MTTSFHRLRRHQKGFTLIELLVVVAIIALLATFAVPKLFDAINKAKEAPGTADLHTISNALERFYMDNNRYPLTTDELLTAGSPVGNPGNYLKPTTTFRNGFNYQYLYLTDATGKLGYVLIDIGNATSVTYTNGAGSVDPACGVAKTFALSETAKQLSILTNATQADLDACKNKPANKGAGLVHS